MEITLRVLGVTGVVLFGILFTLTFLSSAQLETSAKRFVQHQIEKEIRATYNAAQSSSITQNAKILADKLGLETDEIEQSLNDELPQKIASVIAAMCGYDCERKKAVASAITEGYLDRIKNIKIAEDSLGNIIKGKYLQIVENLRFDLRIFLGTNLLSFLVLLVVSFAKPQAIQHLFLPGILLLVATVISATIYIFGQDWFYTILYNDYMGYAYSVYLLLIFAFFMDIVFNRARITTEIINTIANAIGSAFSVMPC